MDMGWGEITTVDIDALLLSIISTGLLAWWQSRLCAILIAFIAFVTFAHCGLVLNDGGP